ncbi:MAG: hypothetical protein K9N09_00555 [Candidatus Cloacimonetes bacterium]|nr:hypothetical protein [Candidatus Cloacimonadota bacterium]MCF7812953.1 hypothetical protein [Candidatus Cloacimonadota bacterium]MCF7867164.1 hypothetical protein [Candidatus Cloacimonadota bacterium]MCF7882516.1 hypothetical protein [Candidatus Cloacimonadota bacterium]
MGFLSRIFGKNKKPKPHNFSRIMRNRDKLVIFLAKDHFENFNILNNVVGLQKEFKEIIFFIDQFAFNLFTRFALENKIKFRVFDKEQPIINEAVIMNFADERAVYSFLKRCNDSTIIDINNESNMQFLPAAKNSLELFERFCEFYSLKVTKQNLKLPISNQEIVATKQRFVQNRFPNFVLEISENYSTRNLEGLIKMYKQNFSANLYLSDKMINTKDLINIDPIKRKDLYELFLLASSADLFITDKTDIADLFAVLGKTVILLTEKKSETDVKCFSTKDLFLMKDFIAQHLKNN